MMEVNVVTCDPEMWADMVYYANVVHDYHFKYWELGNELDLERTEGNPRAPFGSEYLGRYKKYYQALKEVDPSILVVGPATAAHEEGEYFRAFTDFVDPLTNDPEIRQNQMLDVLSYHHYPLWNRPGGIVSYADMFAYTQATEERSRAHINHCAADKGLLLDSRGFPNTLIAVSEFNSIAGSPTFYHFNHANALYMADTLARQAHSGADMVMHWELYDRPPVTGFGLIDHNNSTIIRNYQTGEITLQDNFAPMPVYYTYFMYAQFFGNMLVQSSSSREDKLSIWASTDTAEPNTLKLLVVNLADEPIDATVNLHDFVPGSGRYYELTNMDFVTATDKTTVAGGTSINGLVIDSSSAQTILDSAQAIIDSGRPLGAVGSSFKQVFPAYSATALVLGGGDNTPPVLSCPADITAEATSGSGALVSYPPATATDAVSTPIVIYSVPSGSLFPLGMTTVTVTATDTAGNASTCSFDVTVPPPNTPSGNNITVSPPGSETTVTFSNVSSPGNTSVNISGWGPPPPAGFQLGTPPTYYNISTTATYTAPVTVCINYNPAQYSDPSSLRLFHYENGTWLDVTTFNNVTFHTICGQVNSLSRFVIAQQINNPPAALCQNVTVSAGSRCKASASIDKSSYDPDGDSITYSQSPAGPYPRGNTLVTLTVTDSKGASRQCTGVVTVTDNTPPSITRLTANPDVLWPPNHKMVKVTVNYNATDNCGQPSCQISSVVSNEPINRADYRIVNAHQVQLRAERLGSGNGRIYTIAITCTDASGNSSKQVVRVTVPHDQRK